MVCLAERNGENQTAVDISKRLDVSKIYLEQVLSLLKGAGLVQSVKGSQGGYFLDTAPSAITVYEVLKATENGLFEKTEAAAGEGSTLSVDKSLNKLVWDGLEASVATALKGVTLQDIVDDIKRGGYMFYI
jgi:Rrf2 family protein